MPIEITEKATEQSTIGFECVFKDEQGNAVAPTSLTWTLTDISGNVINDREDVEVESPSSTETIVLSGDDLQIVTETNIQESRRLTVLAVYDSDMGTDLPLKESIHFAVENLVAI